MLILYAPFSIEGSISEKIKVDAIKIASMDANNLLLIKYCIRSKIPLIISTGMCNKNDLIHIKKITKKLNNTLYFIVFQIIHHF